MKVRFPSIQRRALVAFAALSLAADLSRASVVTSGGTSFQTGTPTPTLGFNAPLTLSVTTAGNVTSLVFDEWVTSDGSASQVSPTSNSQFLNYSINGGTMQTIAVGGLVDNRVNTVGSITPNDGFIFFGSIPVVAGDSLTVFPSSFTFSSSPSFNPGTPTTFNGLVFGAGNGGLTLTGMGTAAPEPGTWAMMGMGVGLLGFVTLRRRAASRLG